MYKWCLVPGCTNSTIKTPKKLFVSVPKKPNMRKMWLKIARRNPDGIRDYSTVFFCEDHFNLPYDMLNYTKYKIMGSVKRVLMRPGCLPSRFDCQPDRKRILQFSTITRTTLLKRRKSVLIEEAESAFQPVKENCDILGTTSDNSDTQVLNNENAAKDDDFEYNNESNEDDDDDNYGKASLFCDTIME